MKKPEGEQGIPEDSNRPKLQGSGNTELRPEAVD